MHNPEELIIRKQTLAVVNRQLTEQEIKILERVQDGDESLLTDENIAELGRIGDKLSVIFSKL